MTGYELTFITQPLTDSLEESILDTFGGMVGTTHTGDYYVTIEVTAGSPASAAKAAHMELLGLGVVVRRLEYDLVTRSEIAARLEQTPQAVGNWIRGSRRAGDDSFPPAFNEVKGGVWLWADVVHWVRRTLHVDPMDGLELLTREEITEFNGCLNRRYAAPAEPMFAYPPIGGGQLSTDVARPAGVLRGISIGEATLAKHLMFPGAIRVVPQPSEPPFAIDMYVAMYENFGHFTHGLAIHNAFAHDEADTDVEDRVEH